MLGFALLCGCGGGGEPDRTPAAGSDPADADAYWLAPDDDGKADAPLPAFPEVDPTHTTAAFRRYVGRALALLERHPTRLGRLTFQSIVDGRVRIDELADLTCWDFGRVRKDLAADGVRVAASAYEHLHDARSPVLRTISSQLDGYMWGNRIYVARGKTARELAATLVHETNHVLNRSDVGYYDDLPTSAFLHEYRAFDAERELDAEPYEGVDLVAHVIELYGLDRSRIPARVLDHPLTPRLLPDAAGWRARRVEDDPVEREADCPR